MRAREAGRIHVLFVMEKWCDGRPEHGLSNAAHNFFGSLDTTGLARQSHFSFDEYQLLFGRTGDEALIAFCGSAAPDILILTLCRLNPCPETLHVIRHELGIPIVVLWHDSVDRNNRGIAEQMMAFTDLHVPLDSTTACFSNSRHGEKYLPLWTPQDPRIFRDRNLSRDIDLCFVGSIDHYRERRSALQALKEAGFPVEQSGGQREKSLTIAEYARYFMRSRIALNFGVSFCGPHRGDGPYYQAKGRVFEALSCGTMLLEGGDSETRKWLEPMKDYASFSDEKDLVEKARYYLVHEEEREMIARSGWRKATELYSATKFWTRLFSRAFSRKFPSS